MDDLLFYLSLSVLRAEIASLLGYDEPNAVTVEDLCMEVNRS